MGLGRRSARRASVLASLAMECSKCFECWEGERTREPGYGVL